MRFVFADRFSDAISRRPWLTRLVWRIEAGIMQLLWWTLAALGPELGSRLGSGLLQVLGPRSAKKGDLVRQTLRLVCPDAPAAALDRLERRSWANLGAVFGEYVSLQRIGAGERMQLVDRAGLDVYARRERSAVFFGAHHANWELLALACARAGVPMVALYAPLQNPQLDRLMSRARIQLGCETHARGDSIRPLLRHLRRGGSVGTLIDLRVADGEEIELFGHPTRLPTTAARLALRTGCDLVPMHARRIGRARYEVIAEPPLNIDDLKDAEDAPRRITERMIRMVEGWILEDPALWLAANRRWDKAVLAGNRD